MATLEPLNDFIIVKISKEGEKTKAGMVVAHSPGERTEAVALRGTVITLPKNIKVEGIKKGDSVFVAKWEGQHINYQAEELIAIKMKDILAVVKED